MLTLKSITCLAGIILYITTALTQLVILKQLLDMMHIHKIVFTNKVNLGAEHQEGICAVALQQALMSGPDVAPPCSMLC